MFWRGVPPAQFDPGIARPAVSATCFVDVRSLVCIAKLRLLWLAPSSDELETITWLFAKGALHVEGSGLPMCIAAGWKHGHPAGTTRSQVSGRHGAWQRAACSAAAAGEVGGSEASAVTAPGVGERSCDLATAAKLLWWRPAVAEASAAAVNGLPARGVSPVWAAPAPILEKYMFAKALYVASERQAGQPCHSSILWCCSCHAPTFK